MIVGRDRRRILRPKIRLEEIDYKNLDAIRRFVTDQGRILPRKATRIGAREQRLLAREIKRARHLALLPFCTRHR
ncbi:30S ribosomal protein S18 [Candidatus Fermentibacteria bacterium]|nr:30S ribosomal protein S18 [Candidatus Fermentibacteria bacterium]